LLKVLPVSVQNAKGVNKKRRMEEDMKKKRVVERIQ